MDEVIDDLINLESGFKDGGLDCMEPNIIMQNNVSINHRNCCSNIFQMLHTIYGMKVFSIDSCILFLLTGSCYLWMGLCQVKGP